MNPSELLAQAQALKPCPFCGEEASHSTGMRGDGTPFPYIEYEGCAAFSVPERWNAHPQEEAMLARLRKAEDNFDKTLTALKLLMYAGRAWVNTTAEERAASTLHDNNLSVAIERARNEYEALEHKQTLARLNAALGEEQKTVTTAGEASPHD